MSSKTELLDYASTGYWANNANAWDSDADYATSAANISSDGISTSGNVGATFSEFSAIPSGATINGIEVSVSCQGDGDDYITVEVYKPGTGYLATTVNITPGTSQAIRTAGGATSLWGTTWDLEDNIQQSSFGVRLTYHNTSKSNMAYVYYVQLTVYYTEAATTKTVTDTITLTDAIKTHKTVVIADTESLADSVLTSKSLIITDGVNLADAFFVHKTISLLDALSIADAVTVTEGGSEPVEITVSDVLNIVDSLMVHKGLTLPESIAITDAVLRHKEFALPDDMTVTDAVLRSRDTAATDAAGMADQAFVHKSLVFLDAIGIGDEVYVHKHIVITDSFGAADSVYTHKHIVVTDAFGAADDAPYVDRTRLVQDVMSIVDAVTAGAAWTIQEVDDLIGLLESVLVHKTITVADTMSLADSVLVHKTLIITDALGAADAIPLLMKSLTIDDVISLLDEVTVTEGETIHEIDDIIGLLENILIHKHLLITDTIHLTDTVQVTKPSYSTMWGLRGLVGQLLQAKYNLATDPVIIYNDEPREVPAFNPLIKVYQPKTTATMVGVGYGHMKVKHTLIIDIKGRVNQGVYDAKEEVLRVLGAYRLSPFSGYTMMEFNDGTQHAGYSGFYWWTIELTVWQLRRPVELGD